MKVKELHNMTFNEAADILSCESDLVTTYEMLKDFAIKKIQEDNLLLASHILDAIRKNPADYYDYDYCMGCLENPTPLFVSSDLETYCEYEGNNTYTVMAHINSLDGEIREVTVLEERDDCAQTVYIVDFEGTKCTAVFNSFVCEFYADDKYGIIKED